MTTQTIQLKNPYLTSLLSSSKLPYFIIFGLTLSYFLWMTATDSTWVNTDSDGNNYLAAARYLVLTHATGAPLFNLVNWLLIRLPLPGTDFFQLAIWSAVFSAGTATLLYHITKNYLAPLIFIASGVVVSQSTILELYAPVAFLMVLSYYFHTKDRHNLK